MSEPKPRKPKKYLRESVRRRLESGQIPADPVEVERLAVLLRGIPLFEACAPAELHRLASTAYPIAFEEGEDLCLEGAESDDCYVVVEGEAALTIQGEPVGVVHAGEVVGERGPIEDLARAATVTAKSRVLAYAISRARLDEILSNNANAAKHMRRLVRARYAPDSQR